MKVIYQGGETITRFQEKGANFEKLHAPYHHYYLLLSGSNLLERKKNDLYSCFNQKIYIFHLLFIIDEIHLFVIQHIVPSVVIVRKKYARLPIMMSFHQKITPNTFESPPWMSFAKQSWFGRWDLIGKEKKVGGRNTFSSHLWVYSWQKTKDSVWFVGTLCAATVEKPFCPLMAWFGRHVVGHNVEESLYLVFKPIQSLNIL